MLIGDLKLRLFVLLYRCRTVVEFVFFLQSEMLAKSPSKNPPLARQVRWFERRGLVLSCAFLCVYTPTGLSSSLYTYTHTHTHTYGRCKTHASKRSVVILFSKEENEFLPAQYYFYCLVKFYVFWSSFSFISLWKIETKENEKKKNEIIQPNHNIVVFINFTAKVMEPPLPLLLPDCCRRRHTHGRRRALFKPQKSLKNSFMSSLKHKISALMCRISRARQEVVVAVGSERRSEEETSSSSLCFSPFFSSLFLASGSRRLNFILFFSNFLLQGSSWMCVSACVCVCTCVCVCLVSRMRFNEGTGKRKNKARLYTKTKRRKTFFSPFFCGSPPSFLLKEKKREKGGSWIHLVGER